METDVLEKNPDIVVIYVGINDVWHKGKPAPEPMPISMRSSDREPRKKLQDKKIKVILCTPSVIGEKTDNSNQQDGDLKLLQ